MNTSAVDPLHLAEQRVPPIRCCDKPACGTHGMQAGGLAAQSVNVLITRCILQSNGSPVRLPPSRLHTPVSRRDWRGPIALLLQWVERNEPS